MDRVMVNITWRCNLGNCPYCWANQVVRCDKPLWTAPDKPAHAWARALNRLDPAVFDFVGGEPLAFPRFSHLLALLDKRHQYAITSNLHSPQGIQDFLDAQPTSARCAHFTGSFHPSGRLTVEEFASRLGRIRRRQLPVSVNIIRHSSIPDVDRYRTLLEGGVAGERGFTVHVSPYEHPSDLETASAFIFTCEAGRSHYVINNTGDVYPCLSWFRYSKRARRCMGNVFDESFKKYQERQQCRLRCEMFHVVDPANSMVGDLKIQRSS